MNNFERKLPHIPGYCIVEQLYEGSRTQVYRAIREADQKPVAIKLLKGDYPSFNELVQFRNQYTIDSCPSSPTACIKMAEQTVVLGADRSSITARAATLMAIIRNSTVA